MDLLLRGDGSAAHLQKLVVARITSYEQETVAGASHGLWPQLLLQVSRLDVDEDGRLNFNIVHCPLANKNLLHAEGGCCLPCSPSSGSENPVVVEQTACGGSWSWRASVNSGSFGAVLVALCYPQH